MGAIPILCSDGRDERLNVAVVITPTGDVELSITDAVAEGGAPSARSELGRCVAALGAEIHAAPFEGDALAFTTSTLSSFPRTRVVP